jgi:hypothetical protein
VTPELAMSVQDQFIALVAQINITGIHQTRPSPWLTTEIGCVKGVFVRYRDAGPCLSGHEVRQRLLPPISRVCPRRQREHYALPAEVL